MTFLDGAAASLDTGPRAPRLRLRYSLKAYACLRSGRFRKMSVFGGWPARRTGLDYFGGACLFAPRNVASKFRPKINRNGECVNISVNPVS